MAETATINPFDKLRVNGEQSRTIKCVFCQGKGKDPFELLSELATCQVCNGKGKVNIARPYNSCPACGGSGIKSHSRLVCTVCRGFGVISRQRGTEDCPDCAGSGKNSENDLPCSTCGGSGKTEGTKKKEGDKV